MQTIVNIKIYTSHIEVQVNQVRVRGQYLWRKNKNAIANITIISHGFLSLNIKNDNWIMDNNVTLENTDNTNNNTNRPPPPIESKMVC